MNCRDGYTICACDKTALRLIYLHTNEYKKKWGNLKKTNRHVGASPVAQREKNRPAMWKMRAQSLGVEDPLEKGMATHISILAWQIPRTSWV